MGFGGVLRNVRRASRRVSTRQTRVSAPRRAGRTYLGLLFCGVLGAHPMGNFSVHHYARISASAGEVSVQYVLDLAEIPSFELMQKWGVDATAPRDALEAKAAEEARAWAENLSFQVNGCPVR